MWWLPRILSNVLHDPQKLAPVKKNLTRNKYEGVKLNILKYALQKVNEIKEKEREEQDEHIADINNQINHLKGKDTVKQVRAVLNVTITFNCYSMERTMLPRNQKLIVI